MGRINLIDVAVESREQRLGTVISWGEGKASELLTKCHGKGEDGCRLCEAHGPFTQASICSENLVEHVVGTITNGIYILHSPIGCGASQVKYNIMNRMGLLVRGKEPKNVNMVCTNLTEHDMVFGGGAKLSQAIQDAWDNWHPEAIFVGTSCASGIIGDDVNSVTSEYSEKLGIPVSPIHCEGFRSKHWSTGFDEAEHAILRDIVNKPPVKKQDDLVNIISPISLNVFTPLLKELGLRANYMADLATVKDLSIMSEAALTAGYCNSFSSYIAEGLEQHYGVPQLRASQPYGIAGTDAWIRGVAEMTNRKELAERLIEREHERIAAPIEELRKKLKGKKGLVAAGSSYAHGLLTVLRELGIRVDSSMAYHHDPALDNTDPVFDSLAELVDEHGDMTIGISVRQEHQFYTMLKNTRPDFVLLRHIGLAPLASRMGIPPAPINDDDAPIGYDGIIKMGNVILDLLRAKKFHDDLSKHVKLPYSKWWMDQTDMNILVKHPEMIWDD